MQGQLLELLWVCELSNIPVLPDRITILVLSLANCKQRISYVSSVQVKILMC